MTKNMQDARCSERCRPPDQKIFVKAETYEAEKRSSKGIENLMELAPDVPSVCVDGTVLDPVPASVNATTSKLVAK